MKNIKHIFFDLDNTLWDHRKNAYLALEEIFLREQVQKKYQISFDDFHKEYYTINEDLWAKIRDGKIDKDYLRKHRFYDSFLFFGIDDHDLSSRFDEDFLEVILNYNELVEGAFPLLEYLATKDYTLHILSNGFLEDTNRKAELSGIKPYFKTITSADEINIRKPHADIYKFALEKAGATIEESVMIGDDWIADVEGALAFGLEAVFFDVFLDQIQGENFKTVTKLKEITDIF